MSHKSSADFSPNFIRTSLSNLDSTDRKSSSDRVPTKDSRSSFFESSERVQGDPKTNNNAAPNLFTKQFRSQNSFRKLAASSTLGDLNLSPNFSSSSNRAPLRLQASVDCYPASRSQTRPRAPTISSLGRSSSVRASAENDFNAANAYTDFYPHKRKTSFKTQPNSFKTQSQTSLSSYSQKGALRYSNSGDRNSIDLTNPTKQVSILKPTLKHANTIASLTYETAELLGTPNTNRFWEPQAENSELPKKPMFASHIRKLKSSVRHFIQPTENRLALKLFGSKKAVLKERKRCEEEAPWIIHPYSTF
ncbi:uncharacterized protein LOC134856631, partial [Symsagittifera roscoffensis]|uniref:uncharacterized protein LOC134856631 n=1 Tax=Symsagittifera roscoffensis TaxID=84072 RepID=UPI00307B7DCB